MGFFSFITRPFKWMWKNWLKSEAVKFATKYKDLFTQIVIDVAQGQLEGDTNKQQEAVARAKKYFKGIGVDARDSFVNLTIEMVLSELKDQRRLP